MKNGLFNKISRSVTAEWIAPLLITLTVGAAPSIALGQDAFPDRSLSIVVAFGKGGVSDITARIIADPLGKALGNRVLVKNMPGSSGAVASQYVLQAGSDGYTLLNMGNAATIRATLMPNFEPDQLREFQPVSPIAKFGLVVVTAQD